MVLDLRLKEDWLSGDNQFFCTCTFYRNEAQPTKTQSFMELKKVALFDLDGVVLDTEGQYTVFWQTIGERYCAEVPDFSTRIKGMSLVQILASHEKLQQHEHEIRKAIDEYEETMSYPYIPGAYVVGLSTSCAERDIVPLAEMVVPSFVDATTCLALFEKGRGR